MFEEHLFELYDFFCEENILREEILEKRKELKSLQKNSENIKQLLLEEMKKADTKYVKYKDMQVIFTQKIRRSRHNMSTIRNLIEQIIDQDSETILKSNQIISILKSKDAGSTFEEILKVSKIKNKD